MSRLYFAGLGSNIDPHRHMAAVLDSLVARFGLVGVSRIRQTAPVDVAGGSFLNAVVCFRSDLPAAGLKDLFCRLEAGFGRDRSHPDRARRARTIDIDILFELAGTARAVDAAAIPAESYYRAAAVELIGMCGISCPVAPEAAPGAVGLAFGAEQIGLTPAWLHRDRAGVPLVSRAGRAALVTGGAVRVGREIVHTLAQAGYDIALHYHSSEPGAARTAAECRALGVRCETFRADLSDASCIPALMDEVVDRFPHAALLVNSASVYEGGRIADTSAELLDRQWAVNFKAPFLLMKEFRARATRGAIVNVLDNKIAFNQFHYAAYLTAKKALAEATKMAALEFAPAFRVNGLAPGVVLPAATRDPGYLQWRQDGIPVGHLGSPAQLCEGLKMLISNDFITGQILVVDGGEAMSFTGRNANDFRTGPGSLASADLATV